MDDTGLDGPMGRMTWVPMPAPGFFIRPAPPSPEIVIRFLDATNGIALVGNEPLPFTHAAL